MTHIYYTDGAVSGNPNGPGGYAWIKINGDSISDQGGGNVSSTTNQRMEMMAIEGALHHWWHSIGEPAIDGFLNDNVIIYTDSAYCSNCFSQKWYENWQRNGWFNSKKQLVANRDLWEKLIPYFECTAVSLRKVKGHDVNEWNNIVDKLAVSYKVG